MRQYRLCSVRWLCIACVCRRILRAWFLTQREAECGQFDGSRHRCGGVPASPISIYLVGGNEILHPKYPACQKLQVPHTIRIWSTRTMPYESCHQHRLYEKTQNAYSFSSHCRFLPAAVVAHSWTPRTNGQTFFRKSPLESIPRLKTSLFISSTLIFGIPSSPNHESHICWSIGWPGFLDVLGVGRFIVECSSSNTPREEVSSSRSGADDDGKACASRLRARSPSSATMRAHRAR